jgi:GT2 family glycosyltransferase
MSMNRFPPPTQSTASSSGESVAVIIVNWNGLQYLPACLLSLARQNYPDFQIVVVDNGSTDDSIAYLEQCYPTVHIIRNQSNLGFAAACNQGILATDTKYVALLNNDTIVHPEWLSAMIDEMNDPIVGMCACKMLSMNDHHMVDSAGIAVDRLGFAWGIAGGLPDNPLHYPKPEQLLGPSGGAALYRRYMLEDIGLFDESFFAYLEDVDLAWRAQWAGWRCQFAADAVVFHVHSATTARVPYLKSRLLARNRIWMIIKNYPTRLFLTYLPLLILSEIGALIYLTHSKRLGSSLWGRFEALSQVSSMLRKRFQTPRRVTDKEMITRLQPASSPAKLLSRYQFAAEKQI